MYIIKYIAKATFTFAIGVVPLVAIATVAMMQSGSWWIGLLAGWMAMEVVSKPIAHMIQAHYPDVLLGS